MQVITHATREAMETANILDLILMSDPSSLQPLHYIKELSDHKVILASFFLMLKTEKATSKQIKLYECGNYEAFNTELEEFYTKFKEFHSRSVEINWKMFRDELNELTNKLIPSITIKNKKSAPWFNTAIKTLISKRKRLFRRAKEKNPSRRLASLPQH